MTNVLAMSWNFFKLTGDTFSNLFQTSAVIFTGMARLVFGMNDKRNNVLRTNGIKSNVS